MSSDGSRSVIISTNYWGFNRKIYNKMIVNGQKILENNLKVYPVLALGYAGTARYLTKCMPTHQVFALGSIIYWSTVVSFAATLWGHKLLLKTN